MRCPHPDWIFNRLAVAGPGADMATFKAAAAGAGVAPWVVDYDHLEEDLFALLMAPPPAGGPRSVDARGARLIAREVREAVWEDHERALSLVGVSRGCPFDLHSLVPVPWEVLKLGQDHPRALAWMWEHWGTTWHLRRVEAARPSRAATAALASGEDAALFRFVSADWSPWPVLRRCRERWPALRFDLRAE